MDFHLPSTTFYTSHQGLKQPQQKQQNHRKVSLLQPPPPTGDLVILERHSLMKFAFCPAVVKGTMLRENKCWQPTFPIICHRGFWGSHCANGNLLLHRCHWKLLYRPGTKSHKSWDNVYEYCMSFQDLHSLFMFAFDLGWAMNCQPRKAWMVRIVLLQSWMSPEAPSLASMTLSKGLGIISEIPS